LNVHRLKALLLSWGSGGNRSFRNDANGISLDAGATFAERASGHGDQPAAELSGHADGPPQARADRRDRLPRNKQPKPAVPNSACAEPSCPLVYNGGSVQHSPHVYLLLWGPNWSADPSQSTTASYLENFYAGLGLLPQDSWSDTTDQYSDGSGHPSFSASVYKGVWQDTSTPPTGVDQAQLGAEADAFSASQGITDLTNSQIVVATQSGTCPQGFYAPSCNGSTGDYCAWHSSSNEPYTNLPYVLDTGSGCGEDYVNAGGTHDGFSIVGGHEYAETITDPYVGSGWWDPNDPYGGEIGDKCAWRTPNGDVSLSTGSFAMQSLWSNSANACVMSTHTQQQDTVTVTNPGNQSSYQHSNPGLQMSGSSSEGYSLTWSATGLPAGLTINASTGLISGQVTATPTTYPITVTATDTNGASNSASFSWAVLSDVGSTVKNSASAKCLNDYNGLVSPGSRIVIWTCTSNGPNEMFSHPSNPGELVVYGQCLTDPANGASGTKQVIQPCTGAPNQMWNHNSKSQYVLTANGLCLTDPSGSKVNGTQVVVKSCQNVSNQHWQAAS
jgi:hypothetical protein